MKIPFFSFEYTTQSIKSQVLEAFEKFYDSKWYVLGYSTSEFERSYAHFNKVDHCVGISSGLDALHLALLTIGIGPGDEVIVPSNTYIATVLAISYTGAKPVFVEPRWETCNLNPELIRKSITRKTKCLMPVHLYGQACEMDEIMSIAKEYELSVVEDNAQAHGATYQGKLTGSFGDLNATSFYPTKNLGALGEAGAVTTNDEKYANQLRVLRNYGSEKRYYNKIIGYNNRIDEFEACYLNIALTQLDEWNSARIEIAKKYKQRLDSIKGIEINEVAKHASSVYHQFVIKANRRDQLRIHLEEKGIGTQIHYPVPPHLQEAYSQLGLKKGALPITEELSDKVISLPIWPGIDDFMVTTIIDEIESFYG